MLGISLKHKASRPRETSCSSICARFEVCVVDEKHNVRHTLRRGPPSVELPKIIGSDALLAAEKTRRSSVSVMLSGDGSRKYLYLLPYEYAPEKWYFACLRVHASPALSERMQSPSEYALEEGNICLLLVDLLNTIQMSCSYAERSFLGGSQALPGKKLSAVLSDGDLRRISSTPVDAGASVSDCVFSCIDGTRRDVEVKKFSMLGPFVLYIIFDISPPALDSGSAATHERRRIGQDLHDSVGQLMTGMSLLSRSLANRLLREAHPSALDADQISNLADEASEQIRSISRGLMPSDIIQRGLFGSLRELAKTTTESCGVQCVSQIDESVCFGDGAVDTHLYRIAQEAVNNAVRHANADRIKIKLSINKGHPCLIISDDGVWNVPRGDLNGMGLKTMKYRATAIGAHLTVGKNDLGGTTVDCRVVDDEVLVTRGKEYGS